MTYFKNIVKKSSLEKELVQPTNTRVHLTAQVKSFGILQYLSFNVFLFVCAFVTKVSLQKGIESSSFKHFQTTPYYSMILSSEGPIPI